LFPHLLVHSFVYNQSSGKTSCNWTKIVKNDILMQLMFVIHTIMWKPVLVQCFLLSMYEVNISWFRFFGRTRTFYRRKPDFYAICRSTVYQTTLSGHNVFSLISDLCEILTNFNVFRIHKKKLVKKIIIWTCEDLNSRPPEYKTRMLTLYYNNL
jgi:hypothetical protein